MAQCVEEVEKLENPIMARSAVEVEKVENPFETYKRDLYTQAPVKPRRCRCTRTARISAATVVVIMSMIVALVVYLSRGPEGRENECGRLLSDGRLSNGLYESCMKNGLALWEQIPGSKAEQCIGDLCKLALGYVIGDFVVEVVVGSVNLIIRCGTRDRKEIADFKRCVQDNLKVSDVLANLEVATKTEMIDSIVAALPIPVVAKTSYDVVKFVWENRQWLQCVGDQMCKYLAKTIEIE